MKHLFQSFVLALLVISGLSSCSNQVKVKSRVEYRFDHGRTAMIRDGIAYAPKRAPAAVKRAIAAGNRLQSMPYKWGGGHARQNDSGYDCSGSTSYVLREAGLLRGSMTSKGFFRYGKKGYGKWISVYVRNGHVFLTVAGLRLDTGGRGNETGPRWRTASREGRGHVVRHPSGL
jgi:hypothetical protein